MTARLTVGIARWTNGPRTCGGTNRTTANRLGGPVYGDDTQAQEDRREQEGQLKF